MSESHARAVRLSLVTTAELAFTMRSTDEESAGPTPAPSPRNDGAVLELRFREWLAKRGRYTSVDRNRRVWGRSESPDQIDVFARRISGWRMFAVYAVCPAPFLILRLPASFFDATRRWIDPVVWILGGFAAVLAALIYCRATYDETTWVECKDWKKPVTSDCIEKLKKTLDDVRAVRDRQRAVPKHVFLVAANGYTGPARNAAARYGFRRFVVTVTGFEEDREA